MEAWYLVTTKLKSEIRVKQNLHTKHGLETFFPVYAPKKAASAIGLPLFPRYVFVKCDLERDFQKIQYSPGVSKVVAFGASYTPVPDEVIACLRQRCDDADIVLACDLTPGEAVRVTDGLFEGCSGIIQEKRGNRRVQLLLEIAYGSAMKVEVGTREVERC